MIYSVDVLRLDSSQSSLNHLSSSMIFASGAGKTTPTDFNGEYSTRSQTATSPGVICRCERPSYPVPPWVCSSRSHSSSTRVAILKDDTSCAPEHPRHFSQLSEGEYNGRRHVCPDCLMRFNRPSTLRTHMNSHTGATRECWDIPLVLVLMNMVLPASLSLSIPPLRPGIQCQIQHVEASQKPLFCWGLRPSEQRQEKT